MANDTNWNKNWQSSVSVKITAVFLWVVTMSLFILTILILPTLQSEKIDLHSSHVKLLSLAIEKDLRMHYKQNEQEYIMSDSVKKLIEKFSPPSVYIEVDKKILKGKKANQENIEKISGSIITNKTVFDYIVVVERISDKAIIKSFRNFALIVLISFAILLSVSLTIIIHTTLKTPFKELVNTAKAITKGNMELRLNGKRDDEFGKIANYFNEMLDYVDLQHSKLRIEIDDHKKSKSILAESKEQADKANQAKSAFLANISHEIRTPLNAILGFSQVIEQDPDLNKDHKTYLKTILESGSHLMELINDILNLSKIESGNIEIIKEKFSLSTLVKEVIKLFELSCKEKGLSLEYAGINLNENHMVYFDQGKLKQILINLVGNSVKFTSSGKVLITVTETSKRGYCFEVLDTGKGIAKASQQKIFKPFEQDRSGQEVGGTGLGLSISKRQLNALGSDLLVESDGLTGSKFYFETNMNHPSLDLTKNVDSPVFEKDFSFLKEYVNTKNKRILIVDDTKINRDLLKEALSIMDIIVDEAANGRLALKSIEANKPNLVFMDIQMPEMDGKETIKHIKSNPNSLDIPCVALTASIMINEVMEYVDLGYTDAIAKPFKFESIYRIVSQNLEIYEQEFNNEIIVQAETPSQEIDLGLVNIERDMHDKLLKAASLHDISQLQALVGELESGGHQSVADRFKKCLNNYDIKSIKNDLEKLNKAA